MITGSYDKTIKFWNLKNFCLIKVMDDHKDTIFNAQYSPNNKFLITVSKDKQLILWDALKFD